MAEGFGINVAVFHLVDALEAYLRKNFDENVIIIKYEVRNGVERIFFNRSHRSN